MAANSVETPFTIMTDTDGSPLNNGYVYIGTAGSNPETNPITTYWDSSLVYAAAQPIRTINGYLCRNGSPGVLYVDADDYSITVRDKHGALVYTSLNTSKSIPFAIVTGQIGSDRINFLQVGTGAITRTGESKFQDVINVRDFGATGDGVTDDTAAIQAAIDSIDTAELTLTGGVVYIPRGEYIISSTIYIRNSEVTEHLASVTIRGDGIHNTIIKCADSFTDVDAVYMQHSNYCVIEDLHIHGNDKSTNGFHIENGSEVVVNRVFARSNSGSGFLVDNVKVLTMSHCRSSNPNGTCNFDFSGGYNVALNIENCYALDTDATGTGFKVRDVAYSLFTACACDDAGRYAYEIGNVMGVTFISCGAEETGRAAFYMDASAANDAASTINGTRCVIMNCFSKNADKDSAGYGSIYSTQVDTSVIDVLVERFMELTIADTYSVVTAGVALDHRLKIVDCLLLDSITGVGIIAQESDVIRVDALSVTGANTPILNLSSIFDTNNTYSGLLQVIGVDGQYGDSNATASYVLLVTKSLFGAVVATITINGDVTGAAAFWPSFTWTLDGPNNHLEATPIGSTSGTFSFYITQLGGLKMANV